jgi:NRAMP (natural resistance-associated macrophage protein)-like metal ion transporter
MVRDTGSQDDAEQSGTPHHPYTADAAGVVSKEPASQTETNIVKRFLRLLGPGLITGASDDDPSGIGTYVTAGATLGYATLWTAIVTLPLMAVVQFTCAKIGLVTGKGLAGVLKQYYSKWLLYPAILGLVVANTINAGTDIGAIAAAINLLIPVPILLLVVPVAVAIVLMQVYCSYRRIEGIFKWLTITLFAYVGAAFLARPNWREVLRYTFIPHFSLNSNFLTTIVAILGTTISPYLFFWQSDQEVEEEIQLGRKSVRTRRGATDEELRNAKLDTIAGMIFCNIIFYFVILSAAATLHVAGKTEIQSAADAAQALTPLVGRAATVLFALGLIGAGFLAVPVLTGCSAYAVAESFGWRYGLDRKPRQARQFYAIIAVSTIIGMLINFLGINPIKALFWTAVINGLIAPPLLAIIMMVANNHKIMHKWVNGRAANIIGWIATGVMFAAAIGMILTWNRS